MYISCEISNGLGNRFFQVASMLGYAERYGHIPVFVRSWIQENPTHPGPHKITDYFPNIKIIDSIENYVTIQENYEDAFTYKPLPKIENNVKLVGCFQSEQYFPTYSFVPPLLQSKEPTLPSLFLHVRRGDFLLPNLEHHRVDLCNYYQNVLESIQDEKCSVIVCSDDIPWCKEHLPKSYPCIKQWIFEEGDDHSTLQTMTRCKYGGICANSTFSWWGAYWNTSPTKQMFFPNVWGYPPMPQAMDIYPKKAIIFPI